MVQKNEVQTKKKSMGSWGLLLITIVIGVGVFYLTNSYLADQEASLRERLLSEEEETRRVVVATVDLPAGSVLGGNNMAVAEVDATHVSAYAVTPEQFSAVSGYVIENGMSRGEPLLMHFVSGPAIERFSDLLEEGFRPVTLEVDEIISDAHMLTAGDFIDIYLLKDVESFKEGTDAVSVKNKTLLPLLHKVRIIATGNRPLLAKEQEFAYPDPEEDGYATVTVAVKIKNAAKLELAREAGKLVFFLRNAEDELLKSVRAMDESFLGSSSTTTSSYIKYYSGSQSTGKKVSVSRFDTVLRPPDGREMTRSVPVPMAVETDTNKNQGAGDSVETTPSDMSE